MAARPLALLCCLPPLGLALAGCGAAVTSTSSFKGEQHEVAQTIANLQAYATSAEENKVCANVLAGSVVTRLGGVKGCERAIKNQLNEVDNLEVSVESVQLSRHGGLSTASAQVKSIHAGKSRASTVSLVREAGRWKISGVG
jgi:hypothetical protein